MISLDETLVIYFGHPDSSAGKTVCLCLMTSYIPLPQGLNRAGGMLAKMSSGEKNISMKIPAEYTSGLTVPAGLQSCKCVFRSRFAWFDIASDRKIFVFYKNVQGDKYKPIHHIKLF